MSLILPNYLLNSPRQQGTIIGHHLSHSMLTGQSVQLSSLVQRLALLKRDDVIRQVVHLLQVLEINHASILDFQRELAPYYFSSERLKQFNDYALQNPYAVAFHKQSLWFVLQFAAITCSDEQESIGESKLRESVGDCVLLANEFLDDGEFPADAIENDEKLDETITAILLPILEVGNERSNIFDFARFQRLWFDLPKTERFRQKTQSHPMNTDWHAVFESAYGISISDFRMICAICVSFFIPDESRPTPKRLEMDSYFGTGKVRQLAEAVFKLIAQTPNELALSLINQPRQSWSRDFNALRKRPLLWVGEKLLACPQQSFLLGRLSDGIYWDLVAAYGKDGGKFRTCFGDVFELYVEDLLLGFLSASDLLVRELYPSPKFQGTNDQLCDFYIDWSDLVAVTEVKASLLTPHQKYSGSHETLLRGVDSQIGSREKGIGQLASSISKLIDGHKVFSSGREITPVETAGFLPIIVTYEPLFAFHSVQRMMQRKFTSILSAAARASGRVLPLLILSIDDLELLQGLSGAESAKNVLFKYAEHLKDSAQDRTGTFNSFIWDRYPKARIADDNDLRVQSQALMNQVMEDFQRISGEGE